MKMRTTLAGVLAVLALSVSLAAFGGTREAVADNGDPVILGTSNYASSPTFVLMNSLSSTSTRDAALVAGHLADANDIEPEGIWGTVGNQLFARPVGFQIGVLGTSQGDGVMGVASRNGVFGLTSNNGASGVYGENDGTGYGVAGRAANGTGVLADSPNGTALHVTGKAVFSRSGKATVTAASGKPYVQVSLGQLSPPRSWWPRYRAIHPGSGSRAWPSPRPAATSGST